MSGTGSRIQHALLVCGAVGGVLLAGSHVAADKAGDAIDLKLELSPQGTQQAQLPYYPVRVTLSDKKPDGVKKEPAYKGTPKYGTIRIGDAKARAYVVAIDEPKEGEPRIYVDANGNGDLTDDGDGAWQAKTTGQRVMYGLNHYKLEGGWKDSHWKKGSDQYGVALYRFPQQDYLLMYREAACLGTITLDGKSHKAMLVENDADGNYAKTAATVDDARKTRPIWLLIDLNDDGKFDFRGATPETYDIRGPFKLAGKTYEAKVAADGSRVRLTPTAKEALDLTPKPAPRPTLLAAGSQAPDFSADAWGGGKLSLAQYKGKVVILDFWATWCGPCQRSMPHLEKVYRAVKGQDVVALGVCVWDERAEYDKWVPAHQKDYSFTFAFDPAGNADSNIAKKLYQVSGIPTTYIIDKDGKVADSIVGFSDGDQRIEAALKKLGVKVE